MTSHADPLFPHMADALNPELMGPLLRQALDIRGSQGAAAGGCVIGEKRYKPGRSLLISYRLESDSPIQGQPRLATARLCQPGEAEREFAHERSKRPDMADGALRCLPEPAMLLWVFPYDRKLTQLPRLFDAASLPELLAPSLDALDIRADRSDLSASSTVLHYLPERSCMIRYQVTVTDAKTGGISSVPLYAKNYADDTGADVFAMMRQLSQQFTWGAQALSYDGETKTLWQSHIPGKPPTWSDLESPAGLSIAARMGQCAAALHHCTLDTQRRLDPEAVPQALLQTIALAERMRPGLGGRVRRAVDALLAAAPADADKRLTPVHNDLKLNNFLLDNEALGLIDMDCVCLGNPLGDLASLIANLYLHALREGNDASAAHPVVRALTSAYRASSVGMFSLPQLRWQVAAALIHEVTRRSLRQMDERRMAHVLAYLELSEQYTARCGTEGGDGDELL